MRFRCEWLRRDHLFLKEIYTLCWGRSLGVAGPIVEPQLPSSLSIEFDSLYKPVI